MIRNRRNLAILCLLSLGAALLAVLLFSSPNSETPEVTKPATLTDTTESEPAKRVREKDSDSEQKKEKETRIEEDVTQPEEETDTLTIPEVSEQPESESVVVKYNSDGSFCVQYPESKSRWVDSLYQCQHSKYSQSVSPQEEEWALFYNTPDGVISSTTSTDEGESPDLFKAYGYAYLYVGPRGQVVPGKTIPDYGMPEGYADNDPYAGTDKKADPKDSLARTRKRINDFAKGRRPGVETWLTARYSLDGTICVVDYSNPQFMPEALCSYLNEQPPNTATIRYGERLSIYRLDGEVKADVLDAGKTNHECFDRTPQGPKYLCEEINGMTWAGES